jgi:hypothetical protein
MAKTPAKKSAKAAKVASSADKKGKKKATRSESYSTYLYKVRIHCSLRGAVAAHVSPHRILVASFPISVS